MGHLKFTLGIVISFICSLMLLSVAHAELLTDEKWSFDFKNVSIQDAFNEIKKQTGIEFVVRQKTTQPIMVTYHNKNQSIMQVHRDLLRNVNHATCMNYSDDGRLESINIIIIGHGDGKVNMMGSNSLNQTSGMKGEQKDLNTNMVKSPAPSATGSAGEQTNLKKILEKPPEPPKINGVSSPPMPPSGY